MLSPRILDVLEDSDAATDITATVVLDSNDVACMDSLGGPVSCGDQPDHLRKVTSRCHFQVHLLPGPAIPGTFESLGVALTDWRHPRLKSTPPFSDWHKEVCGPITEMDWTGCGGMLRYISMLKAAWDDTALHRATWKWEQNLAKRDSITKTRTIHSKPTKPTRDKGCIMDHQTGTAGISLDHSSTEKQVTEHLRYELESSNASASTGPMHDQVCHANDEWRAELIDLLDDDTPEALGKSQALHLAGAPHHNTIPVLAHGPSHKPECYSTPANDHAQEGASDSWQCLDNAYMPKAVEDFMRLIGQLD